MIPPSRVSRSLFCYTTIAINLFCLTWRQFTWADCRAHYNDALNLLNATTKKAAENQHPNADTFAADFKTIVDQLQNEKCMTELMSLMQHIQSEQQKLPPETEPKKKPAPILD